MAAQTIFFSRDVKVFMKRNSLFYEIPVLDGFSFSQAQNSTEVTLSEAASSTGTSRRGKKVFNDSFAPSEWSFGTYCRPFIAAASGIIGTLGKTDTLANHHAVEEMLWEAFVDKTDNGGGITNTTSNMTVDFSKSNQTTIGTFDLYFILNWNAAGTDTKVYKIADAVVNEATIDFDIEGIATINWSGLGGTLSDELSVEPFDAAYSSATDLVYEGVTATNNYIRNKLSTIALTASNPGSDTYSIVLTGGNLTFSNNLTYLTPETLGSVNQPLGHVTGTRSISGNFTAYLDDTALRSAELFSDIATANTVVTNSFAATFTIGGATAPKVAVALAAAHLDIPTFDPSDTVSVDVNFNALGTDLDSTDEATITYTGIALA